MKFVSPIEEKDFKVHIEKIYTWLELNKVDTASNDFKRGIFGQKLGELELETDPTKFHFNFNHYFSRPFSDLNVIKTKSKKDFKIYLKEIVSSKESGFFGHIFEIRTYGELFKRGYNFRKIQGEAKPDFEIVHKNEKVFLECTSSQYEFNAPGNSKEIKLKIESTIDNKNKKDYASRNIALLVDITNVGFQKTLDSKLEYDFKFYEDILKERIQESRYGAILFVTIMPNLVTFKVKGNIHIEVHNDATDSLEAFSCRLYKDR